MSSEDYLIGVVVEVREPVTRWGERRAHAVAVESTPRALKPWTALEQTSSGQLYYAGPATLSFHADATGRYLVSLEGDDPRLWVVVAGEGGAPFELILVTADSDEGEALTVNPGYMIETVPMPAEIAAALARFTTTHHRERGFIKRKRKEWRKDDSV